MKAPLLATLLLGLAAGACGILREGGPAPEVVVAIRAARITAEVTDTGARKQRGLSGRETLPPERGMLFLYDPPAQPGFWMPDMHFDLDIVWIREGRIVDLSLAVPHEAPSPLPRYRPREDVDTVLEVVAGTAGRHGWRIGDPVRVETAPAR